MDDRDDIYERQRRDDELNRQQDRDSENFRDDQEHDREKREREHEEGWEALRAGNTMSAIASIAGPELALKYAELSGYGSSQEDDGGSTEESDAKDEFGVLRMKFHECGPEGCAPELRVYRESFEASRARYVCFQTEVRNPWPARDQTLNVVAKYEHFGSRTVVGEVSGSFELAAGNDTFWYWGGFGSAAPGTWVAGSYRVEMLVDGQSAGAGWFSIEA